MLSMLSPISDERKRDREDRSFLVNLYFRDLLSIQFDPVLGREPASVDLPESLRNRLRRCNGAVLQLPCFTFATLVL